MQSNSALARTIARFVGCVSLYLCLAGVAFAQAQTAESQSTAPAIKVTTHIVVLSVVVHDKSGKLVTNLSKDDFAVFENDERQALDSFEPPPALPAGSELANGPAAPAVSATAAQPRTILVLDELNTISEDIMFAAQKMQRYLLSQPALLPQATSIYLLNKRRLEAFAPQTRDRDALVARLKTNFIELPPHYLDSGGVQGGADRLVASLMALDEIALSNADQKGRKNVIWVGNGIPILSDANISGFDRSRFQNWVHYTANWMEETQTTVYMVDPRGVEVSPASVTTGGSLSLLTGPDFTAGELVFEQVAAESGGAILRNRNDIDVEIASAVHDGGSYYTIAYYPTNRNYDGGFRRIKIKIETPGVYARTQQGYYAYPDGFENNGEQIDFALSRSVTSLLPFRSISFSATGERLTAPAQKNSKSELPSARLILAIQRDGLSWTPQPDGSQRAEVSLVTSELSSSNKVLGYKVREVELIVEKSRWQEAFANQPVELSVRLDLPAKTDRIRLVVRDSASGHLGTFDLPAGSLVAANIAPSR
ncbi:MAG TPA: VWA domain-containing protein [Candidatus Acidoferrum sp.]|jgi:VWFA-related protein